MSNILMSDHEMFVYNRTVTRFITNVEYQTSHDPHSFITHM